MHEVRTVAIHDPSQSLSQSVCLSVCLSRGRAVLGSWRPKRQSGGPPPYGGRSEFDTAIVKLLCPIVNI